MAIPEAHVSWFLVSILLLTLCVILGVWKSIHGGNQPEAVPTTQSVPSSTVAHSYRANFSSIIKAQLRPLKTTKPAATDHVEKVWRELLAGMVKDPRSRELIEELHGGVPTELALVDANQAMVEAVMLAPPPEGIAIVFRMANDVAVEQRLEKDSNLLPVRVWRFSQVVLIENSTPAFIANSMSPPNVFNDLPPREPMLLLMEDYIFRHAPGWVLIPDLTEDDPKLPSGTEEQRQQLDERIKKYSERAKTIYDVGRKRN